MFHDVSLRMVILCGSRMQVENALQLHNLFLGRAIGAVFGALDFGRFVGRILSRFPCPMDLALKPWHGLQPFGSVLNHPTLHRSP